MKTRRVISYLNLPVSPPTLFTMVALLYLDRFHAPGWLWGASGAILAILWVAAIGSWLNSKSVDIFKTSKGDNE